MAVLPRGHVRHTEHSKAKRLPRENAERSPPYIGRLAHGRPLELPPRNSGSFVADIESEAAASTHTATPRIKTARLICPASPGEDRVGCVRRGKGRGRTSQSSLDGHSCPPQSKAGSVGALSARRRADWAKAQVRREPAPTADAGNHWTVAATTHFQGRSRPRTALSAASALHPWSGQMKICRLLDNRGRRPRAWNS